MSRSLRQIELQFRSLDEREGRKNQYYCNGKLRRARSHRRADRYNPDTFWNVLRSTVPAERDPSRPIYRVRGTGRVKYLTEAPTVSELIPDPARSRPSTAISLSSVKRTLKTTDEPPSAGRSLRAESATHSNCTTPPKRSLAVPSLSPTSRSVRSSRRSSLQEDDRLDADLSDDEVDRPEIVQHRGRILTDLLSMSRKVEVDLNTTLDVRRRQLSEQIEQKMKGRLNQRDEVVRRSSMILREIWEDDLREFENRTVSFVTSHEVRKKFAVEDVLDRTSNLKRLRIEEERALSASTTPVSTPRGGASPQQQQQYPHQKQLHFQDQRQSRETGHLTVKNFLVCAHVIRTLDEMFEMEGGGGGGNGEDIDEKSLRMRNDYYSFKIRCTAELVDENLLKYSNPLLEQGKFRARRMYALLSELKFSVRILGSKPVKRSHSRAGSSLSDVFGSFASSSDPTWGGAAMTTTAPASPSSSVDSHDFESSLRPRVHTVRNLQVDAAGFLRFQTKRSSSADVSDGVTFSPLDSLPWLRRDWRRLYGKSLRVQVLLQRVGDGRPRLVEEQVLCFGLVL